MHTAILYQPMIAAVDLAGNSNINTSASVTILNADGAPFGQAMYATPFGITPILNPISPNNAGYIEVYADKPQAVLLRVNGQDSKSAFTSYPEVPFWYEDVRVHGASLDATSSYNQGAIMEAVAAVLDRGGGKLLLPELYHISGSSISVVGTSTTVGQSVHIIGTGRECSGLIQDTLSEDVLTFGANDSATKAHGCGASDMVLQGGNRGLRLNNAIGGQWSNLKLFNNQTGLQTVGQCEKHQFAHLWVVGSTTFGLDIGADNGVAGAAQETQKTVFTDTVMESLVVTATNGIRIDGGLGATGNIAFDGLVLENGPGNWIQLGGHTPGNPYKADSDYSQIFSVSFSRLSIEEAGVALTSGTRGTIPAGGWTAITQGAGTARLSIYDSVWLHPTDDFGHPWKYVIDQQWGHTVLINCEFTGEGSGAPGGGDSAGTAIVNVQANGLLMLGGNIGGGHSQVTFSGTAKDNSLLLNVLDASNLAIHDWDLTTSAPPFIAGDALGVTLPDQTYGVQQKTRTRANFASIPGTGTNFIDLGPTTGFWVLWDKPTGKIALFTTDAANHTITEISDPNNIMTTDDTGAIWTVIWLTTSFILKNKTGAGAARIFQLQRTEFLG